LVERLTIGLVGVTARQEEVVAAVTWRRAGALSWYSLQSSAYSASSRAARRSWAAASSWHLSPAPSRRGDVDGGVGAAMATSLVCRSRGRPRSPAFSPRSVSPILPPRCFGEGEARPSSGLVLLGRAAATPRRRLRCDGARHLLQCGTEQWRQRRRGTRFGQLWLPQQIRARAPVPRLPLLQRGVVLGRRPHCGGGQGEEGSTWSL
jgi:hypothetical protein